MSGFNSKRDAAADKLQEPAQLTEKEKISREMTAEIVAARALAQPAQEPLSDDSIFDFANTYLYNGGKSYGILEFARAIEAAHGIKGNT